MRNRHFTVTLSFSDDGHIDTKQIEANLRHWLQHAIAEGTVTPNDDGHAMLLEIDLT